MIYRGGERPSVVFVGEAPGAAEDREGLPFVGRSGRQLDDAIREAGVAETEYGIVNLIKCRPPENRFPPASGTACRPFLDRQLALLAPRLLVSLGAHALAALDPEAPTITRCAGQLRRVADRPLLPLLHPAAALHNPTLRTRWRTDLAALGRAVRQLREQPS